MALCHLYKKAASPPARRGSGVPEPLRAGGQQLQLDIHPSIPQEYLHGRIPLNPEAASRPQSEKSDFLSINIDRHSSAAPRELRVSFSGA